MFIDNYNNTITKNSIISQSNLYNLFESQPNSQTVCLIARFNTFKNEKSLKLIRLYNLCFFFSNQRPFLKKIKFNHIKKKILKRFFLITTVCQRRKKNVILYLSMFYIYFFHLYYQKNIKHNFFGKSYILYLDNVQLFFRNYGKQAQKTQLSVFFKNKVLSNAVLLKYLSNVFLVKLRKIK